MPKIEPPVSLDDKPDENKHACEILVKSFLNKHLSHSPDAAYTDLISDYLMTAAKNYSSNCSAETFIKIIESVERMLPANIAFYQNRKAIVQLFYDIQNICNVIEHKEPNHELTFEKLIATIISESEELVPKNTINYSDIFLYDFLQGLFGYCELSDISNDDYINAISTALSNISKFSPMRCRIDQVVKFLKKYEPQIDDDAIHQFIDRIISKMMKKYEINNIAKLIK